LSAGEQALFVVVAVVSVVAMIAAIVIMFRLFRAQIDMPNQLAGIRAAVERIAERLDRRS
jgi:hypothetical protein